MINGIINWIPHQIFFNPTVGLGNESRRQAKVPKVALEVLDSPKEPAIPLEWTPLLHIIRSPNEFVVEMSSPSVTQLQLSFSPSSPSSGQYSISTPADAQAEKGRTENVEMLNDNEIMSDSRILLLAPFSN